MNKYSYIIISKIKKNNQIAPINVKWTIKFLSIWRVNSRF